MLSSGIMVLVILLIAIPIVLLDLATFLVNKAVNQWIQVHTFGAFVFSESFREEKITFSLSHSSAYILLVAVCNWVKHNGSIDTVWVKFTVNTMGAKLWKSWKKLLERDYGRD